MHFRAEQGRVAELIAGLPLPASPSGAGQIGKNKHELALARV